MLETIPSPQPLPFTTEGQWFVQDSGYETLCSAITLLNAVRANNPELPLSKSEVNDLLLKTPLSDEIIKKFLESKGYELAYYRYSLEDESAPNPIALAKHIITTFLENHPMTIKLSSHLAKQKEATVVSSFEDHDEHKNKMLVHRVLVRKNGDVIEIIDPYDPSQPERFRIDSDEDMLKFMVWLFSVYYEQYGTLKNGDIQASLEELRNDPKFDTTQLGGLLNAGIRGIRPQA